MPRVFRALLLTFLGLLAGVLLYALVARWMYPPVMPYRDEPGGLVSRVIQVEVRNGCGVEGVAREVTRFLRAYGFDVVESGNYEHFNVPKTLVLARRPEVALAHRVARVLGVPEQQVQVALDSTLYLDVTVIVGKNYTELVPFKRSEQGVR